MLKNTSFAAIGTTILLLTAGCATSDKNAGPVPSSNRTPTASESLQGRPGSSPAPPGEPGARAPMTPSEAAAASGASTAPPKNVVFKDLTDYEKEIWQKSAQLNSGHKEVPIDIVALEATTREQCQWSDAKLVEHLYARHQADIEQGMWDDLVIRGSFRHLCPTELSRFEDAAQIAMKQYPASS